MYLDTCHREHFTFLWTLYYYTRTKHEFASKLQISNRLRGENPQDFPPPQRKSMFWSFWDKSSKWNYPQVGGRGSENLVGLNFWPLFVTKNGILRFSAFGLIKWSWIKNSKWNYPQFRGCGSENFIGLNFWPLFVTQNGIWCFSAFSLIKWSWIKNSKWNYPQFRGCGSENFIRLNFWLLFVTKNCILYFFQLLEW